MPLRAFLYTPKKGTPRPGWTYRGARRNEVFRPDSGPSGVWRGVVPTHHVYHPPVRLNRSARWRTIKKYSDGPSGGR